MPHQVSDGTLHRRASATVSFLELIRLLVGSRCLKQRFIGMDSDAPTSAFGGGTPVPEQTSLAYLAREEEGAPLPPAVIQVARVLACSSTSGAGDCASGQVDLESGLGESPRSAGVTYPSNDFDALVG